MFASSLPWRQRAQMFKKQFPQFTDLLVAVIDAQEPEEADDTAAALAGRLAADHEHFLSVRRPDASPFFDKEGLRFLDTKQLESLTDRLTLGAPVSNVCVLSLNQRVARVEASARANRPLQGQGLRSCEIAPKN